jgi:hypothetical protein
MREKSLMQAEIEEKDIETKLKFIDFLIGQNEKKF